MKKKVLLILSSVFALAGCELDITLARLFGKDGTDQTDDQAPANYPGNPGENDGSNTSSTDGTTPSEDNTKDELNVQEYTAKINLSGSDFSEYATDASVQADKDSYPGNQTKLKEYCDSKLEYQNLIKSLECTKLNTAKWGGVVYLCVGTGNYRDDRFNNGIFKWTSGEKIYKVSIEAQAYAKEIPNQASNVDLLAHIAIDLDDHSLEVSDESELEFKTFEKEYPDGVKSFSIKSLGGRVLLKSITITWRG